MKVYLSSQASAKLEKISNFILQKWDKKTRDKFIERLISKFNQISNYPNSCPKSTKKSGIYKCVLSKQTTFYYRINNNEIEIITFFDSRQDPERLKI